MGQYSNSLVDALWAKRVLGKENLTPGAYRMVMVLPGERDNGLYFDYEVIGSDPERPRYFFARRLDGPYRISKELLSYADWGIAPSPEGYLGQHYVIRIDG